LTSFLFHRPSSVTSALAQAHSSRIVSARPLIESR
jgi:hypothetical protein